MEQPNITEGQIPLEEQGIINTKGQLIQHFRFLIDLYTPVLMISSFFIVSISTSDNLDRYIGQAYKLALIFKVLDSIFGLLESRSVREKNNTSYSLNFFLGWICQIIIVIWVNYLLFNESEIEILANSLSIITILNTCHRTNLLENVASKLYTLILIMGFFLWNIFKNTNMFNFISPGNKNMVNFGIAILLSIQSLWNSGSYRAVENISTLTKLIIIIIILGAIAYLNNKGTNILRDVSAEVKPEFAGMPHPPVMGDPGLAGIPEMEVEG